MHISCLSKTALDYISFCNKSLSRGRITRLNVKCGSTDYKAVDSCFKLSLENRYNKMKITTKKSRKRKSKEKQSKEMSKEKQRNKKHQ